ncbi:hypothetical protein ABK040_001434 [Willaertia magna]
MDSSLRQRKTNISLLSEEPNNERDQNLNDNNKNLNHTTTTTKATTSKSNLTFKLFFFFLFFLTIFLLAIYLFQQRSYFSFSFSSFLNNNEKNNQQIYTEEKEEDTKETYIPISSSIIENNNEKNNEINNLLLKEMKEWKDDEKRRNAIRNAFLHAWKGYEKVAFGHDEVRPVTNDSRDNFGGLGATIVDSMDTMLLMDLKDEYLKCREYIVNDLNFDKDQWVSVFETNIRYIGGLLSVYELTKDNLFLEKARDLANKLIPAFHNETGFPYTEVNLKTGNFRNAQWHKKATILSEVGSLQLEWKYLSKKLNNYKYFNLTDNIIKQLDEQEKKYIGLYSVFIASINGKLIGDHITLGALGDSFYEYLLKQWILFKDKRSFKMYREFMKGLKSYLIAKSKPNHLVYISEFINGHLSAKFDHLVCFAPGMLALGSTEWVNKGMNINQEELNEELQLAKDIALTCYETYKRQATGIGPEIVNFNNETNDFNNQHSIYILRPELIESLFILYRITGDLKYKEWGWNIFLNLEKHCKTSVAYAGLKNVNVANGEKDNAMESFFLSETLKYLYLLFTDNLLPLDKYVFTTEAHPLGIY